MKKSHICIFIVVLVLNLSLLSVVAHSSTQKKACKCKKNRPTPPKLVPIPQASPSPSPCCRKDYVKNVDHIDNGDSPTAAQPSKTNNFAFLNIWNICIGLGVIFMIIAFVAFAKHAFAVKQNNNNNHDGNNHGQVKDLEMAHSTN